WNLDAVDLLDGYAIQHGVYSSTASFTPQMTTGTSNSYTSCEIMFKAASAGTAPTQSMRIVHLGHFSFPSAATTTNTQTIQMPSSGNLLVASFTGGGDCIGNSGNTACATTSSIDISDSQNNTWKATGTVATAADATSQMAYAGNATTAATLSITVGRHGDISTDATNDNDNLLLYDITGAATSPFDNDAGTTGNQTTQVSSLTTCSSCLSPTTSSGIVLLNANWEWCTATTLSAPSGAVFDSAFTTMNSVDGPQPVDQNGGWAHFYNTSTSTITATWTMTCDQAESDWAGRVSSFKAGSQTQPPPPTGLTGSVQPQP
ncbi:MAG: hypothetical protein WA400_21430, partial [Silvibacterium sp.]